MSSWGYFENFNQRGTQSFYNYKEALRTLRCQLVIIEITNGSTRFNYIHKCRDIRFIIKYIYGNAETVTTTRNEYLMFQ